MDLERLKKYKQLGDCVDEEIHRLKLRNGFLGPFKFDRKEVALLTITVFGLEPPMSQYKKFSAEYRRLLKFPGLLRMNGWEKVCNYMPSEGREPTEEDFQVGWFWEGRW